VVGIEGFAVVRFAVAEFVEAGIFWVEEVGCGGIYIGGDSDIFLDFFDIFF